MNIVHNCDCQEFMKTKPDNYYDLAIVDPPYGIERFKIQHKGDYCHYKDDNKKNWNNKKPDKKYFEELFRISKNQIVWGMNNFTLPETEYFIVWDKQQFYPNFARCELAWTNIRKPAKIFKYGIAKEKAVQKKEGRLHPAQKPVALYKWLLQNYAKPGQTIFDSHVGSGSIRIACHDLGFDFEGCELDEDYWKAQEERYKNHAVQGQLFETNEIQDLIYKKGGGNEPDSLFQL